MLLDYKNNEQNIIIILLTLLSNRKRSNCFL